MVPMGRGHLGRGQLLDIWVRSRGPRSWNPGSGCPFGWPRYAHADHGSTIVQEQPTVRQGIWKDLQNRCDTERLNDGARECPRFMGK